MPRPRAMAQDGGIGFDQIGGLEAVKEQIRRKIINPFSYLACSRPSGAGPRSGADVRATGLRQDPAGPRPHRGNATRASFP